jgi:hypothetical protein
VCVCVSAYLSGGNTKQVMARYTAADMPMKNNNELTSSVERTPGMAQSSTDAKSWTFIVVVVVVEMFVLIQNQNYDFVSHVK